MIKYISTRGGVPPQGFEDVLLAGLAHDGGLFVPERWPKLDLKALKGKSYIDTAEIVMTPFIEGVIDQKSFRKMLEEAYGPQSFLAPDTLPLIKLRGNIHLLELFHGPTISFKDVALQLLGRLFDHVLTRRNERITIVGATSGDTGSAAIEGCRHSKHVDIFILFPKGRVSDVQRLQMTGVDAPNVHCIEVEGTFDDCQGLVKTMFGDEAFRKKIRMNAVNSINWARLAAQTVYYVYAALKAGSPEKDVSFAVPTGNFGNVYAAYAAQQMGLPIQILGMATNRNDILTRFFETGEMRPGTVAPTISPSMDIQVSSNFERFLFDLVGRNHETVKELMAESKTKGGFKVDEHLMQKARKSFAAYRCDEDTTKSTMKKIYQETGYVLDPHTAVGVAAALEIEKLAGGPVVALSTAHPAKFPDAVEEAIGKRPELPASLDGLFDRKEHVTAMPKDLAAIQKFILSKSKT
jgi:threonine synthase